MMYCTKISSTPLEGNNNFSLGLWFCLDKLHCVVSWDQDLVRLTTPAVLQSCTVLDGEHRAVTQYSWSANVTFACMPQHVA